MYMAYKPEYRRQEVAKERQFKGMPFDNLEEYIDASAVNHVTKIETPLLVHATTYDRTVPHPLHRSGSSKLLKALRQGPRVQALRARAGRPRLQRRRHARGASTR